MVKPLLTVVVESKNKLSFMFLHSYISFDYLFNKSYISSVNVLKFNFIKNRFFKLSTNNKFVYFKIGFLRKLRRPIKKGRKWIKFGILYKKFARGYFPLFVYTYMAGYSSRYLPFIFNLNSYGEYLQRLKKLPYFYYQIRPRHINKRDLKVNPLIDKFRRLKFLQGDKKKNILYGYKFHFSGRFTRKQKAASLWYTQGANPVSSMDYEVDYGFHTVTLRYSACTLKVWLFRNKRVSFKHGYRVV